MGMFDWVRCTRIMPDGAQLDGKSDSGLYQTKCMENDLLLYEITEDGQLRSSTQSCDHAPDTPLWDVVDFDGTMDFYGSTLDKAWHEYRATFVKGQLTLLHTLPLPWAAEEQAELDKFEAWFAAATPEEKATYQGEREEAMRKAGEAVSEFIYTTSNRKGFLRRMLEKDTQGKE